MIQTAALCLVRAVDQAGARMGSRPRGRTSITSFSGWTRELQALISTEWFWKHMELDP